MPSSISVQYWSSTFTSGDTFASASINDGTYGVSGSRLYASAQTGANVASVSVESDVISPFTNSGFWNVSVNRTTGIATVGLTYGFGTRKDIENSQPDFIVNSVAELSTLLFH